MSLLTPAVSFFVGQLLVRGGRVDHQTWRRPHWPDEKQFQRFDETTPRLEATADWKVMMRRRSAVNISAPLEYGLDGSPG